MSRLLVLVLLGQTLGACADARWSDVGAGPKITEERWYANGLVATLGPRALARYAEHGPELLSLALPSGVVIPTKTRQALIGPASVAVGEALPAPRAMPVALAAALEETQQAIRLDVTFTTLTYRRPMTGIGAACAAAVTLPSPQLRLALVGRRDVAGHVFFEPTVDGAIVSAGTPTITLDAGCTLGDGAALSTQLGEWALDDVRAALTATSSDAGTSPVSRLALLGARLFGAALPGRLELAVPDAGGFDGRMTVELSPATVDGTSQVVHVGTTGAVLALRVGVDGDPAGCSRPPPVITLPPTVPVSALAVAPKDADVAIAVRKDVLEAVTATLLTAGGLCGWTPAPTDAPLHLGALAGLASAEELTALGAAAPVQARVALRAAPKLSFRAGPAGEPMVDAAVPSLVLEVYVHRGDRSFLLRSLDLAATLTNGRLVTRTTPSGPVIAIDGGDVAVAVSGVESKVLAAAVGLVVRAAFSDLALFALPDVFPFPLLLSTLESTPTHLVVHAALDVTAPPRLALRAAPLDVSPPAASCAVGRTPPMSPLWLLALGLLWWRRHVHRA